MIDSHTLPLVFNDYDFLARYQVRIDRPNGQMQFLIDSVQALLPDEEGVTLIDLGGGTNSYLSFMHTARRRIVCDCEPEALAGMRGVETIRAALPETGLPDGMAEWVSAAELIEHLPAPVYEASLREIARLSRRFAAITAPFMQHLESGLVRCVACRSLYQCEGHLRRYAWTDILGLQERLGGLVRFGFFRQLQSMSRKRVGYQLRRLRHVLRRLGLCGYARPPFTKCPVCQHEEFFDYEGHQRRARQQEDPSWLAPLPWSGGGTVGNFFLAVFDRQASRTVFRT